ncbi:glycine betaine ABC transporter substrate-binding protein [Kribbella sp. NPDC050124]|uniref:glycine betaine ABC transporter substrate-binding protein n=1 Tax=Kribbella sp. NPDC050124 TaxID=3364114 RepID=UPI0037A57DC6
MIRKMLTAAGAVTALALSLAACSGNTQSASGGNGGDGGDKQVTIGVVAFDESIASGYLWKELLEKQGYKVTVDTLDVAPVYAGVANNQIDFSPALSQTYQSDYWNQFKDKFTELSSWYGGVSQAVAVPKSLGITSMDQLAGKASEVGNQIVGIESGSGLMSDLHKKAVTAYGLQKLKIIDGSTPAMLATLDKAMKDNKPVAVTLWQPHWALSKYPVIILKDPKGVFGGEGSLSLLSSKKFESDDPKVVAQLRKFKMTADQLQSLELKISEAGQGHEQDAVKAWIQDNQSVVDQWTSATS